MFDAPRSTGPVASLGDYVQPTLGHGLRIWWAFYWRTALSAIVLAIALNSALRLFLQIGIIPEVDIVPVIWVSRFDFVLFYYVVALFVMAYILRKKFHSFRIGLFSNYGGEGAQPLQPTMRRTARVWWAFSWRAVVYRIIATVVASIPLGWIAGLMPALLPRPALPWFNIGFQMAIDGAVGMFVIYSSILDEDIADFRVALAPRAPKPEIGAVTPASATTATQ
jgi:hypothetical protein